MKNARTEGNRMEGYRMGGNRMGGNRMEGNRTKRSRNAVDVKAGGGRLEREEKNYGSKKHYAVRYASFYIHTGRLSPAKQSSDSDDGEGSNNGDGGGSGM